MSNFDRQLHEKFCYPIDVIATQHLEVWNALCRHVRSNNLNGRTAIDRPQEWMIYVNSDRYPAEQKERIARTLQDLQRNYGQHMRAMMNGLVAGVPIADLLNEYGYDREEVTSRMLEEKEAIAASSPHLPGSLELQ